MAGTVDPMRRGDSAIWLAGSGLGICLIMIAGMISLILANGLGFFWPKALTELTLTDGTVLMGEIANREPIPKPGTPDHLKHFRVQLKLGNRDRAAELLAAAEAKWKELDENNRPDRAWHWPELTLCELALEEARRQVGADGAVATR